MGVVKGFGGGGSFEQEAESRRSGALCEHRHFEQGFSLFSPFNNAHSSLSSHSSLLYMFLFIPSSVLSEIEQRNEGQGAAPTRIGFLPVFLIV